MANTGNEQNEAFWAPDQRNHPSQQQPQQFVASDGSIGGTSNSYFQPSANSGFNHGHPPSADNFTVLSDGFGNFIKVYHQSNEDVNLNNPGKYEYELFSSNNNFVRPAPPFGYLFHQQQQQSAAPVPTTVVPPENTASNTNLLINQLVGNWAPTISGTYSPFGGGGPSLLAEGLPRSSQEPSFQAQQSTQPQSQPLPEQPQPAQKSPAHQSVIMSASVPTVNLPQPSPSPMVSTTASSTNINNYNQLNDDNSAKLNQNVNKKQRMVAEVKPMRMSYSDVLSKNVAPSTVTATAPSSSNGTNGGFGHASAVTTKHVASPAGSNGGHGNKPNKGHNKKTQLAASGLEDKFTRKPERNNGTGAKKSTMGTQSSGSTGTSQPTGELLGGGSKPTVAAEKSTKKAEKFTTSKSAKGGNGYAIKKNRARNFNDSYTIQDVQSASGKDAASVEEVEELEENEEGRDEDEDSAEYDDDSQSQIPQNSFMYNVKKTNSNDGSGLRSSHKRSGRTAASGRTKIEKNNQQTNSKRGQRPRKNQKYVIIQKIINAWIEYTVIVLLWLWSLVSDVVYLSFRLFWDYLIAAYQYCKQHVISIKQELQQNRPGAWFKGVWMSFDNRFGKDSKWAFWRRGNKNSVTTDEQADSNKNYYKDGRLPTTADEAMSSLLNCKGKDAYSILGVRLDCSQEQIRKHYKKIAVLVHPDKNKQPGAEEAFKVLQRSFELIGEPENRKAYDQSLAEALNAEKAWSEINDLLTQLHTKISEAANTIRCSSCCLRHPRKPTGRPHYAARECNSCKIRHSAREGDIWAETSFFGLRWKYLAMMEGNVYDITEWANCQKGALSHLQPNSHIVQYRIVLGGSQQQQQQQQNQQQGQHASGQGQSHEKDGRTRKDASPSEPNLDDFLNNIYGGQNQPGQQQAQSNTRRRHRRN
ncbi:dnaJ homolog dnj-5 [Wyeomyia smithii]|uniref:dnaJ homolog dnj-5 n=1 Tax=Wyeomyia smithii TaxID=174621 RepID=UPI002467CB45|nr:dnaJ homolog dnj-5 [Wyeomyia smithii]